MSNFTMNSSRWKVPVAVGVLASVWLAFFASHAWAQIARYCTWHYDFGIYSQAVASFRWDDWNPWISARGLRIFNEHFDPILLVTQVFRPLFGPQAASLITEQLLLLGSTVPLLWLWAKGRLDALLTVALCALLLFSVGTIDSVQSPIHPTAWALLPGVLIGLGWAQRNGPVAFVAFVLLLACKEENVFTGPFIAVGFWLIGQRRWAIGTLLLTVLWGAFVFVLRAKLLGPTVDFFHQTTGTFLSDPLEGLRVAFSAKKFPRLGTLLLPFVPLVVWSFREKRPPYWALLAATLPLMASRFLAGKWGVHYGPPLVGLWLGAFVPVIKDARVPRWAPMATLLLVLGAAEAPTRKTWAFWFGPESTRCSDDPARLASIERGLELLSERPDDAAIVSSALVGALIERPEIYSLTSSERVSSLPYRYLFIEKFPVLDPWPMKREEVSAIIEEYRRRPTTRILFEDEFVLFAEGEF